jgi:murein DD-endopeptidase MepM/ murein hydrolase activator NlpD
MLINLLVVLVTVAGPAWSAGATAVGSACLRPPVDAPIVDHFRQPACPFCAGNRGLTYAVDPGTPVRAVAAGTVTFAGPVAGTTYVVIGHVDGRRATYGGVSGAGLRAGQPVPAGAIVGWTEGSELHFGLREGERYVDPEPFIGRLVDRARLVPTDGTPPRPAPPPVLRCGLASTATAVRHPLITRR